MRALGAFAFVVAATVSLLGGASLWLGTQYATSTAEIGARVRAEGLREASEKLVGSAALQRLRQTKSATASQNVPAVAAWDGPLAMMLALCGLMGWVAGILLFIGRGRVLILLAGGALAVVSLLALWHPAGTRAFAIAAGAAIAATAFAYVFFRSRRPLPGATARCSP